MASFKNINKYVSKSFKEFRAKRAEARREADPEAFILDRLNRVGKRTSRNMPTISGPSSGRSYAVFALLMVASLVGCTDATVANMAAYGSESTVVLYGCGSKLAEYKSTGIVKGLDNGYCEFVDKATGQLVALRGDVQITVDK